MLDSEDLEEVLDMITQKVILANRSGELEDLLAEWVLSSLINRVYPQSTDDFYDTYRDGKIVVLGSSEVKEKDLLGIVKSLGLDKDRFEFCLDYGDVKGYEFSKLRYNPKYRLVMVGPMPHSSSGKGDSGSAIAEMENNCGYPRVVRLGSNELKITKSNFKKALNEQLVQAYI